MPVVCKITLDAEEYRRELDRVTAEARQFAEKLGDQVGRTDGGAAERSLKNAGAAAAAAARNLGRSRQMVESTGQSLTRTGENFSKVGGALSAMGSRIGAQFGAAGQAISALSTGPLALLGAALGTAVRLVGAFVERWREARKMRIDGKFDAADSAGRAFERQAEENRRVREGLETLYRYRNRDVSRLTRSELNEYSDAMRQVSKSRAADAFRASGGAIHSDPKTGAIVNLDEVSRALVDQGNRQQIATLGRQIDQLRQVQDEASRQINAGGALSRHSREALESLGVGAISDPAEASRKAGELLPRLMEQLQELKDDASYRDGADFVSRRQAEAEDRGRDFQAGLRDEFAAAFPDLIRRGSAEILAAAEKRKGGALTDEERQLTLKLAEAAAAAGGAAARTGAAGGALTNALTARGGFAEGAAAPDLDRINRLNAEYNRRQADTLEQIKTLLDNLSE